MKQEEIDSLLTMLNSDDSDSINLGIEILLSYKDKWPNFVTKVCIGLLSSKWDRDLCPENNPMFEKLTGIKENIEWRIKYNQYFHIVRPKPFKPAIGR